MALVKTPQSPAASFTVFFGLLSYLLNTICTEADALNPKTLCAAQLGASISQSAAQSACSGGDSPIALLPHPLRSRGLADKELMKSQGARVGTQAHQIKGTFGAPSPFARLFPGPRHEWVPGAIARRC
jgi:hypothetical protein